MRKLYQKIIRHRLVLKTWELIKKIKISRKKVPLVLVVPILYQKLTAAHAHQQASAIAFSFTLSLFPAILFLFSLIPFVAVNLQIPNYSQNILDMLREGMPPEIYLFVAPTIEDIIGNRRSDVLSFGFLFAIYAATSAVVELMYSFNLNYKFSEKRSFIYRRLVAMWLAFVFAFLLFVGVLMIIVGELVLHLLKENIILMPDDWLYYGLIILRYLTAFLVFYVGISYIYYVAPAVKGIWRFFSSGSFVASVLAILSTYGFSYYLSHFATYNKLYGSIGTLIALLVWFYLIAWVLLMGFALNASIQEAKIAYQAEQKLRFDMLEDL